MLIFTHTHTHTHKRRLNRLLLIGTIHRIVDLVYNVPQKSTPNHNNIKVHNFTLYSLWMTQCWIQNCQFLHTKQNYIFVFLNHFTEQYILAPCSWPEDFWCLLLWPFTNITHQIIKMFDIKVNIVWWFHFYCAWNGINAGQMSAGWTMFGVYLLGVLKGKGVWWSITFWSIEKYPNWPGKCLHNAIHIHTHNIIYNYKCI